MTATQIPTAHRLPRTWARTGRRRGLALLGPAFVAAIAYVDPGNVATNTAAGAGFGYLLVWVVVTTSAMGALVQYLSAKLGLATGRTLPELLRDRLSTTNRLAYWLQAEAVVMATDVAEILGGAIALNILFDLPLLLGGLITAAVSTAVLMVQDRRGQRAFEFVIAGMLAVIAIGFLAGLFVRPPDPGQLIGGLLPAFDGSASVILAAGMLGATVMPHAIHLHSALVLDRHGHQAADSLPRLLRVTKIDIAIAMSVAATVNLAMVLLAANAPVELGTEVTLPGAHQAIGESYGPLTATLFAAALLISGLASSSVGAYAGSVVMGGLLRRSVPVLLRRLVALAPAVVILLLGIDPTTALVLSQVVLALGLPFVLVPLLLLTRAQSVMGPAVNSTITTVVGGVAVMVVIALNLTLLGITFFGG